MTKRTMSKRAFIIKYFSQSSWAYLMNNLGIDYFKDIEKKKESKSSQLAINFCAKYKIKEHEKEFKTMFYIFSETKYFKIINSSSALKTNIVKDFFNEHSLVSLYTEINQIKFISIKGKHSLSIKNKETVQAILQLVWKHFQDFQRIDLKPKPFTNDIRVFSWALLNYYNQYTQYKTPKNILATDEQCRMIYEALRTFGIVNSHIDPEDYIRAYLKQASAIYS